MGINIVPGAGPLGRTVSFSEFDVATQKATPQIIASDSNSAQITGDGTAKTIFTDSFTAPTDGEMLEIYCRWDNATTTAGSNVILKLGTYTVSSVAHGGGAAPNHASIHALVVVGPNSSGSNLIKGETFAQGASISAPTVTRLLDNNMGAISFTSLSLTNNPNAANNPTFKYTYWVKKYKMGV